MGVASARTRPRFWPQKVRTRLTLTYAALFLAGGILLLGLTYGLLAASLPTQVSVAGKPPMTTSQYLKQCKRSVTTKPGAKPETSPPISDKLRNQCEKESAYLAGSAAAVKRQRDRALHNLLLFSALGLGIMTILSAGAGWVIAGRVLRPVRIITGTARRASEQNLGERIALSGAKDELKE